MTKPLMLSEIIRQRQTCKILGDVTQPITFSREILVANDTIVKQSIATAGWAPFHYDRGVDGIAEPWRVHFMNAATCRQISVGLGDWVELKPSNKLPAMLSACGCLVLVTWLPQFRGSKSGSDELPIEKQAEIDDEHLAASAAMVQNLLLLLTGAGLGTYWSSGGQLGSSPIFERLGIGTNQRLMAAVFVEYPNGTGPVIERIPGKNRELRADATQWLSDCQLPQSMH